MAEPPCGAVAVALALGRRRDVASPRLATGNGAGAARPPVRMLGAGRWALWCAILLAAMPLAAAPTLRTASLRFGNSPRLHVAEWAYLNYQLENPDREAVTVRLSLRSSGQGRGVFDKSVTLAPGVQLRGRELVIVEATTQYTLSLFRGGERLERTDVPINTIDQPLAAAVVFLNDDPDFAGSGDLTKPGRLKDSVNVVTAPARLAPHHWAAYGHTRLVAVAHPRYRDLNAAQFEALATYVHRGGTVLFCHPEGVMAAVATPWATLLPVVPLRVRRLEALPELDAWGEAWTKSAPPALREERQALVDRDGVAFLEATALGDGLTTLHCGTYPLIRWRRCGLGRVGVVAIDPCQRRLAASGALVPLWNHILANALPVASLGNLENSHVLPTVLGHLTGFRIPSAGAVGWVLYGYVGFLVVLLLGGLLCRRQALSWGIAAVSGLVATSTLFVWAYRQNRSRPSAGAAILDVRASSGERTCGSAVVSLFAKTDRRPDVLGADGGTLLRPLPSPARGKRREPLDAPLIVDWQDDRAGCAHLSVQALKPRDFGVQYGLSPLPVEAATLTFGDGPVRLTTGALPATLAVGSCRTFLLAPTGLLAVSRNGGRLTGVEAGQRLLDTDPFLKDLGRYLVEGAFPRPALVALLPAGAAASAALPVALPGFTPGGYTVHVLPVAMQTGPGRIRLDPEFLRLEAIGIPPRAMLRDDPLQGAVLRMASQVITFDVVLPATCADLRADEVTVDLDLGNVGGNVSVEPRLLTTPWHVALPAGDPGEAQQWVAAMAPTALEGSVYRFVASGTTQFVQPAYGRCRLLLRVSQKAVLTVATEAERVNRWRLNRLRVAMAGTLPAGQETRRF